MAFSIDKIKYNLISATFAALASILGKIGSSTLQNSDWIKEYTASVFVSTFIGILPIALSLYLNSIMIIYFYKSLHILGTTKATSVNYSINVTITFLVDTFLFKNEAKLQNVLGIGVILIGIFMILNNNSESVVSENKDENKSNIISDKNSF